MESRLDRELKSYAEPINAADLQEGSIYFFVNFVDEEMLVPTMGTMVYIGENLESDDVNQVYFQDIDSYNRGVRYRSDGDGDYALFETGSKNELGHVRLRACARRVAGVRAETQEGAQEVSTDRMSGSFRSITGDEEAALIALRRAEELEPGSLHRRLSTARHLFARMNRHDEAARKIDEVLRDRQFDAGASLR
jgi:hypothetical protein